MARVEKTQTCWFWTGGTSRGYGVVSVDDRQRKAHRVVYELLVGPIPEGLELDHVKANGCTSKVCVKAIADESGPTHLEPVTGRTNVFRGDTITARNAAKTHCKRGHEFTPENTRISHSRRICRACVRSRNGEAFGMIDLRGCPLANPSGQPRTCEWDGKDLPSRARRWCSRACASEAATNHSWSFARPAALRRDDYRCTRCGQSPRDVRRPQREDFDAYGDFMAAHDVYLRDCWRVSLEVNHKTPILGKHHHAGCHHHLDGLETLCRPCHLAVTTEQARERARARAKVAPPVDQGSLL